LTKKIYDIFVEQRHETAHPHDKISNTSELRQYINEYFSLLHHPENVAFVFPFDKAEITTDFIEDAHKHFLQMVDLLEKNNICNLLVRL